MIDRLYRVDDNGAERFVIEREGRLFWLEGDIWGAYAAGAPIAPSGAPPGVLPANLRVLAPVVPSKIVGIGLNYKDHAAEQRKPLPTTPLIFLKPPSAVVATGEEILLPAGAGRVDYEAEMAVVIGKTARGVAEADAGRYVLGITALNDVTARDMQSRGVQYSHCKGFDTFAPMGPAIAVGLDHSDVSVECWVNGVRRQASTTRELVFTLEYLVSFVSSIMTLLPGDVISTGTPAGIAPLAAGDTVTVRVGGVGDLTNRVAAR